jgi:hypothetical protein
MPECAMRIPIQSNDHKAECPWCAAVLVAPPLPAIIGTQFAAPCCQNVVRIKNLYPLEYEKIVVTSEDYG